MADNATIEKPVVAQDFWADFETAEGGVELSGENTGEDGRVYLSKAQWVAKGITIKAKLKMSDASKTKDNVSKPYMLVVVKGRAYAAYLSTAVKEIVNEVGLKEGDSLKNLAEFLTLACGVEEREGVKTRTFQMCVSGGDL